MEAEPTEPAPVPPKPSIPVLMLPWDFRSSFPEPLPQAIEAGKINEDDCSPENLRSLHDEHARHALAILSDLDALGDARRLGVDPGTGKPPRTPKQKENLQKRFEEEMPRLEHAYGMLMESYEDVFGDEPAQAFGKAIRAEHADTPVIAEWPPLPTPLASAVEQGIFGKEEDGSPVHPSDEEVAAITDPLAEQLVEMHRELGGAASDGAVEPQRQAVLTKLAEDFGPEAAEQLDRWARLKAQVEDSSSGFDASHPWHYYREGDAAEPIPAEQIPPHAPGENDVPFKLPKNPSKRSEALRQWLADQRRQLEEDCRRYAELLEHRIDALSDYDRNIAHGGNEDMAWSTAVALKYNHIRLGKGRVAWLEKQLGIGSDEHHPTGKAERTQPATETPNTECILTNAAISFCHQCGLPLADPICAGCGHRQCTTCGDG
jgi:hypothetical protein